MNEWSVQLSKQADIDLRKIYEYIAFTLLEPVTAGKSVLGSVFAKSPNQNAALCHS